MLQGAAPNLSYSPDSGFVGADRFTFVANMVGHWLVGLPVAVLLGLAGGRGVGGLWWGLCAGLSAVAAALLARFLRLSGRPITPLAATATPHGT